MSDPAAPEDPRMLPAAGRIPFLVVPLSLAVGLAGVGLLVWEFVPPGVWHDDGAYLLLGKSLADGDGLRYSQVAGTPPGAKFPPLYPLFLALLWRVAPEAVGQGSLASLFNLLFVASSGGLFTAYLRSLNFSWWGAAVTTVLFWSLPDLWRLALVPLSEPLFLVSMVAALWAGSRLEAEPTWGRLGGFLAVFAFAFHTRSMGLALGIAVPMALLLRGRRAWAVWSAGGALSIVAPWMIWSGSAGDAVPAPLRDTLGSYSGWLAGQVTGEGGPGRLVGQALSFAGRIIGVFFPGAQGWGALLVGGVALAAVVVGVRRVSARTWTPILTAALLLLMLWLWPYQEIRLTMPLVPVLGLLMVAGFGAEVERLVRGTVLPGARPEARTVLVGAMGLVWMVALGSANVVGLWSGRHVEPLRVRELMLARAMSAVEERVPPGSVVGAPELWAGLALHTGRLVAPSARFRLTGAGPIWGSPSEQFAIWSITGMEYVVMENAGMVHQAALDELDARCPGAVQLQASWGGGMLVRLDWDDACRALVVPDT